MWQFLLGFGVPNAAMAIIVVLLASRAARLAPDSVVSPLIWWLALVWGVVVLPVSYWIASRVSRIIQELHASTRAIERGDFSLRVRAMGEDELAVAASSFNAMREELGRRVAQLQENRDRMAAVLSGMVEGVLAVDPQQRVLLANEACFTMLGIPTRDVVGRPLLEVVRNLEVQETVLAALRGEESTSRELAVTATARHVVRVFAKRLPGDPCPGVVVVLHDVTELRQLENLRRDFVANVSHELKTPLSSIKAYAETLRLGALEDAENNLGFVERIEEQAGRLHRLILDLLHLSRVETGTEAFEFGECSLREICLSCIQQHASMAEAAGVALAMEEQHQDAEVWADADGMRMIADNLVANALKFTPAGGRVTIRWRHEPNCAVLEVQDTGIGIARQHQERIFERFYRVDKARSRELGGTGLGLAIVKHLAQAFGGRVGVSSEPGLGSTFQVRLPFARNRG
jgi:two-component system phosphate regulon sensor histidine kinase PhoR